MGNKAPDNTVILFPDFVAIKEEVEKLRTEVSTVVQDNHTHRYDNDCDTTCNVSGCTYTRVVSGHIYNKQVVADKYLKSAASCSSAAVYYKSCDCGAKGTSTFTSGSKLSHKSDSGTATKSATCTKEGTKTYKCTVCDNVINTVAIPATGNGKKIYSDWSTVKNVKVK